MNKLDLIIIRDFVTANIGTFHAARLGRIRQLKLEQVLRRKNPYLFRAKNITTAEELIHLFVDAWLSSSEEGLFGAFLEQVAIFVAEQTSQGRKSPAQGIDLEFDRESIRYLIAIKSGPNWGNSSQKSALKRNFITAARILRQSAQIRHVQAVLGTCYGRDGIIDQGDYLEYHGQSFWEFISGEPTLYIDLIAPLGYQADWHNAQFEAERNRVSIRLIEEFSQYFSAPDGQIDWPKLIAFNSGRIR